MGAAILNGRASKFKYTTIANIQQLFLHRDFVWQISQWTIRAIFRTPRSAQWPPTPWACSMSSRNGYHHICTFKSCPWCQGFTHASDPGEEPHQFLCGKAVEISKNSANLARFLVCPTAAHRLFDAAQSTRCTRRSPDNRLSNEL